MRKIKIGTKLTRALCIIINGLGWLKFNFYLYQLIEIVFCCWGLQTYTLQIYQKLENIKRDLSNCRNWSGSLSCENLIRTEV